MSGISAKHGFLLGGEMPMLHAIHLGIWGNVNGALKEPGTLGALISAFGINVSELWRG